MSVCVCVGGEGGMYWCGCGGGGGGGGPMKQSLDSLHQVCEQNGILKL